jgi:hypothetical protein
MKADMSYKEFIGAILAIYRHRAYAIIDVSWCGRTSER